MSGSPVAYDNRTQWYRVPDVQLAALQEDAALLTEVVVALRMLHDETADYIQLNHLGDPHHNQSMKLAQTALAKVDATGRSTFNANGGW